LSAIVNATFRTPRAYIKFRGDIVLYGSITTRMSKYNLDVTHLIILNNPSKIGLGDNICSG